MSAINTQSETYTFCGQEIKCISKEEALTQAQNLSYSATVDGIELAITTLVNVIEELPQEWTSSDDRGNTYRYNVEFGRLGHYVTIFRTLIDFTITFN